MLQRTKRPLPLRIVGFIFVLGAVWTAVTGVSNFVQQLEQRDWVVRMAVVTEVRRRTEWIGRHARAVYDVTYEYNDNNDTYTGAMIGKATKWEVGDRFDVKCDPSDPENSTCVLEPQPGVLLITLTGAGLSAAMGLWAAGYLSSRRSRRLR